MSTAPEVIQVVGEGYTIEIDPSTLEPDSIIIVGNNSGPYITTAQEMADEIPERGRLVQVCGGCGKAPPRGGNAFAKCGKCGQTGYCSRECQAAHWKEHKGLCKERAAAIVARAERREAARLAGKRFCTPLTLQEWYRENHAVVEYAAFHVLELYKGKAASLVKTHIVVFTLKVDKETPEDARLVRLVDFGPAPYAEFAQMVRMSESSRAMCRKARRSGHMMLYFMDMKEALHLLELHQPPPSEPYTSGKKMPHPYWRLNVTMKLNDGLPTTA